MRLGVCREWFHLMRDIKHSMCKLKIVWNLDDCGMPLHAHFRRGVTFLGKLNYWTLLTSSWDPLFRYREYSGRRRSLEAAFEKKADMWI